MIGRIRGFMLTTAAMLALAAAVAPGATGAEDAPLKVFGYITAARAAPLAFEYNQPSFGVPATPTFEMRFMHAQSRADSGPSAHALSSVLWPGDLAGNAPPSLLFDTFLPLDLYEGSAEENAGWTQFRSELVKESARFPSYPVRAESAYPESPGLKTNAVAAGVKMRAETRTREGRAETTTNRAEFPGVYTAGHMNSTTFSGIRDGIAHAEAYTEAKDMVVFPGAAPEGADVITVDAMRSRRTVVGDGETAVLGGSFEIAGLRIAGNPVIDVTPEGPRLGGNLIPWKAAKDEFDKHFAPQGIIVRFKTTVEEAGEAHASSRVTGVEIEMNAFAMARFADGLPEPMRSVIRNPGSTELMPIYNALPSTASGLVDSIVQFDQSMTFIIGDVSVNGAASAPFELPTFEAPPPPPQPPQVIILPGEVVQAPPVIQPAPPVAPPVAFAPRIVPVASFGVPAGVAFLMLLLALAGTFALRRLADRATVVASAAGPTCNLER